MINDYDTNYFMRIKRSKGIEKLFKTVDKIKTTIDSVKNHSRDERKYFASEVNHLLKRYDANSVYMNVKTQQLAYREAYLKMLQYKKTKTLCQIIRNYIHR